MSRLFKVSVDYILELDTGNKVSIGHLDEEERRIIVGMIRKFEVLKEARKLLRGYGADLVDDEFIFPPLILPYPPSEKNNDT